MTGQRPGDRCSDSGSDAPAMTKPNCTITERHDEMLDELVGTRYASRSEALRVAIEEHYQSVSDGGETVTEQLVTRVTDLNKRVDQIAESIADLEEHLDAMTAHTVHTATDRSPQTTQEQASGQITDAVEQDDDGVDAAVENDVYAELAGGDEMSVSELGDELDREPLVIREAIDSLVDRGLVTTTDETEPTRYRPTESIAN